MNRGGRRAATDASGDRDVVLLAVYREHFRELVGLARWLLDEPGLAEEVVQEAFARTYASWARVRRQTDPLPYVRRAVVNLARSGLRRRAVERRADLHKPSESPSAELQVVLSEDQRRVAVEVERLPRRQRECVVLRYASDASVAQISRELGISEGAVKQHLHRAHASLTRALADMNAEEVTQ